MKIYISPGILRDLAGILSQLGFSSGICMIANPSVAWIASKLCSELGSKLVIASNAEFQELIQRARGSSCILGFGSGSAIDTAKLIAHRLAIPWISIPSTGSNDGIASPFGVMGLGPSRLAKPPLAVIADLELIARSPARLLAAGACDLIGKLISSMDWEIWSYLTGGWFHPRIAKLARDCALQMLRLGCSILEGSIAALHGLIRSLINSGICMMLAGCSFPCSGSEHNFCHALDRIARNHALHGEKVGLGTLLMAPLHGLNFKIIRKFLESLNIPLSCAELGLDPDQILNALMLAPNLRPQRALILRGLDRDSARRIAIQTGVI